jgi:hypothetical protein
MILVTSFERDVKIYDGVGKLLDGLLLKRLGEEQNHVAMFGFTLHYSPLLSPTRRRCEIHSSKTPWRSDFSRFPIKFVIAEKSSSAES